MAKGYEAAMPAELELAGGFTVRLTAINATTGAVIPGITVSDFVAIVDDLTGLGGAALKVDSGPYLLIPGPGA